MLQAAARRLGRLNATGEASVTGTVQDLHDDPTTGDRWRVKIRGQLTAEVGGNARRTVWVRLPDQTEYDRAIAAHRERTTVRVAGSLSSVTGRVELNPQGTFEITN
jgi:hypothetical protein